MKKLLLAGLLSLAVFFSSTADIDAGKGYSSGGGKSYSSGGHSGGFSGGGHSSGFSSGGGKGYTSTGGGGGGFSTAGKGYSNTSNTKSYSSSGGGKGYTATGRTSYTSPVGTSVAVAPKPPARGSSGISYAPGTSYTTGDKTYTAVSPSGSRKPRSGTFDSGAAAAQKRVESRAAFVKGPEPRPSYTTPSGTQVKIDPKSPSVETVRSMDYSAYRNRDTRTRTIYAPYYGRPAVVYNDPYNSYFWWWLLDRPPDQRAYWAYCHRSDMDASRYRDLLATDATLQTRVDQLEAQQKARDPNYVPPGLDPDLPYTDDYVNSIYNPHVVTRARTHTGTILLCIFVGGVVLALAIYLVFFHNWPGPQARKG